ncbi:MAG TPA: protein kinase, partial [Polyangiaceae bacterium]|nr:protein kinase [Polyangiaceae bacterium]
MNSEGQGREKACPTCGTRYPADALFCSIDGAPLSTARPGAFAASAATDPYLGREILGHIEIRQLVGIGAMGRVYRAFQRGIDRDVAVKILHRELSANQTLVARFHREAKVASRLAHPHVVHVLLVGQLPDGAMYIVMEFLDGMSLQSALAAVGGAMPLPRVIHIALALCDAAGEAHAQGIVHRDFKPENVMLVSRADDPDFVKVLDFGIARLNWDEHSMATAAGLIFGTARYISPEGAQGEKVGPQGDVYSIATMVYQMLSGRTPFDADQAVMLLVQQIHDPPAALKGIARAAYVPDLIAAVVMTNLSKKPEERAPDARALGRALLDAALKSGLSAQDILAPPSLSGRGAGAHASVVQMPSMQRTGKLQLETQAPAGVAPASTTERPPSTTAPPGGSPTRTEVSDPAALLPGSVSTTRWIPPADFEARIQAGPPSGVDTTIDDRESALHTAPPLQRTPAPPSSPGDVVPMHPLNPRRVFVTAAFFLVGAVLTAAVSRAGWFRDVSSPRAAAAARAGDAGNETAPRGLAELS